MAGPEVGVGAGCQPCGDSDGVRIVGEVEGTTVRAVPDDDPTMYEWAGGRIPRWGWGEAPPYKP
jgi:hypothetical protein